MAPTRLRIPDPDSEPTEGGSLPSTDIVAASILARAWSWNLVKTTLYQSTLIIYIVGPFIYTIGLAKRDEIPGMLIMSYATITAWTFCASILGLSSIQYLSKRRLKISLVFLIVILSLTSVMKNIIDIIAIMMLSLVMATLCPGLKDEIPPLLPIYQGQNQF
ncbi:hypothetical protein F5Y04DRAFT_261738 [Hypomontagnella monticulosa]|nr:hypothetical protein F5Y04DRAFT_261738 [Hypomontagnella monticulosa]